MHAACSCLAALMAASVALAELPSPRLRSALPHAARRGASAEIALRGENLDGATRIDFGASKIVATIPPKQTSAGELRATLAVPADHPLGAVELRVVGAWGASNPIRFLISDLAESVAKEPDDERSQAQPLPLDSAASGVLGGRADTDWFKTSLKPGKPVMVEVASMAIGSKALVEIAVFDPRGRLLAREWTRDRLDPRIAFVPAIEGDHLVRVRELSYEGGPDRFYRLAVHSRPTVIAIYPPAIEPQGKTPLRAFGFHLPGGKDAGAKFGGTSLVEWTLPSPPAIGGVAGEPAWPDMIGAPRAAIRPQTLPALVVGVADRPPVMEIEPNDVEFRATRFAPPADLVGRLDRRGDRDWFRFTAKKGEEWEFAAVSARLGLPTDLRLLLRRVPRPTKETPDPATDPEKLQDVGEASDEEARSGGRGRRRGAPPTTQVDFRSPDPTLVATIPEDGDYLLEVRDEFGTARGDIRMGYLVHVRKPSPDFSLVAFPAESADASGLTLRSGGTLGIHVALLRRGGFTGAVEVRAEDLPVGVSARPASIRAGASQAILVLESKEDAKPLETAIRIIGTATGPAGAKLERMAESLTVVWPSPGDQRPAVARMADRNLLAVRSSAPFRLAAKPERIVAAVGTKPALEVEVVRLWKEFKGQIERIQPLGGPPPGVQVQPGKIDAGKNSGTLTLDVTGGAQPGRYSLVLQGLGKPNFRRNPADLKSPSPAIDVEALAPPIELVVVRPVGQLRLEPGSPSLKLGGKLAAKLRFDRQNGYAGKLEVSATGPAGLTVKTSSLAAGQSDVPVEFSAAAPLAPGDHPVRFAAVATVDGQPLGLELRITVKVVR
ncbi:MAG TPA: hypothetical protein VNC50_16415 [Planctomycetia bacterium]|nr:hypothetical protein [Planctomycetia bacterium]